jgi:AcrR family transcriptional regulator
VNASRSARERVRAELIREITEIARRQLATEGAAGLSLRAIAREMGMVSSAIYRYFPSRDDLLTTLIIDGYNAIGMAVEKAEAACPRDDYHGRWLAGCQAVRDWALAHPHEYALVYGSPVPGYRAPDQTIGPASRAAAVLGQIVSEAHRAGVMTEPDVAARTLAAWAGLFGLVSFELFGQFENVVTDRDAFFGYAASCLGRMVGLPS